MEAAAYGMVSDLLDRNEYIAGVAACSIAVSLRRIADAQERQADRMDALENPPTLDEQMAAIATLANRGG